jgi:hypothetical protein
MVGRAAGGSSDCCPAMLVSSDHRLKGRTRT